MFQLKTAESIELQYKSREQFSQLCKYITFWTLWTIDLPYEGDTAKMSVNHKAVPQWATQKQKAI